MFVVKKRFPLNYLGEGWEDGYLLFAALTYKDTIKLSDHQAKLQKLEQGDPETIKKVGDSMLAILQDKFIEGKGYDGTSLVEMRAIDLVELPVEVISKVLQEFTAPTSPKE
jgi:hypothetical protein